MGRSLVFLLFVLTTLSSCGQGTSGETPSPDQAPATNSAQLTIDTFSVFPPEIDGCACYFSHDEAEFKSNLYIYADNFGDAAFVRINGTMTRLMLSEADSLSELRQVKVFTGGGYELTIDITQVGQIDETWQQKGTMVLKPKNGPPLTKSIYGECGC